MFTNRIASLLASTLMASAPVEGGSAATPATPATLTKKPETVIEGMDSRRMFDSTEDAAAYLNACAERFPDFDKHPQVLNGFDDDGNFLDTVYTPGMRVMVAVLANRATVKGQPSTVKAIVVTPAPSLDMVLADDSARAWLTAKVLDKELNHVAVRALRTADDVESVSDQMPLTLADFISSSRESTGGIMETFNTLFKGIIAALAGKSPAWAKARLIKSELKRAMESKAYALEYYPQLEDRGDKPSLFAMALQLGQREAKKQGLDPTIFDKWVETRDAKPLTTKADEADESEDFELDDLAFVTESAAEGTSTEPATDATPAASE